MIAKWTEGNVIAKEVYSFSFLPFKWPLVISAHPQRQSLEYACPYIRNVFIKLDFKKQRSWNNPAWKWTHNNAIWIGYSIYLTQYSDVRMYCYHWHNDLLPPEFQIQIWLYSWMEYRTKNTVLHELLPVNMLSPVHTSSTWAWLLQPRRRKFALRGTIFKLSNVFAIFRLRKLLWFSWLAMQYLKHTIVWQHCIGLHRC